MMQEDRASFTVKSRKERKCFCKSFFNKIALVALIRTPTQMIDF